MSVSRLSIYTQSKIFAVFHRDLDKPGKSPIVAAAEISCGKIAKISLEHYKENKIKDPNDNTKILDQPKQVVVKLEDKNDAHAEIEGTVSDGLAKKYFRASVTRQEHAALRTAHLWMHSIGLPGKLGSLIAGIL